MKMDTCILCKSSKKDDVLYGDFLKKNKIGVHTYCLYLSSNLSQNGADDEGFLGFLEADIRKEVKRISLLKCCYCNKAYANIGCCAKKCRRTFHFICGLENNCENQFYHDFRSFCNKDLHIVQQRPAASETCLICYDNLKAPGEKFNGLTMIQAPCCHNGWFHKLCLQKFAKTAGYFFKCPLCNDAKIFREKLPAKGIFIPNQDAAWEMEPNAFAELLERPSECAAIKCTNRRGRKSKNDQNPFVMCSTCGSTAMHMLCLANGAKKFHCADCTIAIAQDDSGRGSLKSHKNHQGRNNNEEDEEVDVCHVSDNEDIMIIRGLSETPRKREQKTNSNGVSEYKTYTESNKKSHAFISDHSSDDYSKSSLKEEEECSNRAVSSISSDDSIIKPVSSKTASKRVKRCSINSISSDDSIIKPVSSKTESKNVKRCSISSISSDDSIIKPVSSKTESKTDKLGSKTESDDYNIKPVSSKKDKRCSKTSIASEDSVIKPVSSKTASKTDKLGSKTESDDSDIKPVSSKKDKRCSTTSISSDDSVIKPVSSKTASKTDKLCNTPSIASDDSVIKPVSSKKDKRCSTTSVSSEARKKRSLILISDSDDEEQHVLSQTKSLRVRETKARPRSRKATGQCTTITSDTDTSDEVEVKSSKNSSILTDFDDDDDSDDPLESFNESVERRKNISCIAMRTRRQSQYVERLQDLPTIPEDLKTPTKASSSSFKPLKTDTNTATLKSSHVLEGSFIAKRTRRKSMACMPNNIDSQKENLENISTTNTLKPLASKALHSRRRTICASSTKERYQEMSKICEKLDESDEDNTENSSCLSNKASSVMVSSTEMSQIYEKLHESDENSNCLDEQLYDCVTDEYNDLLESDINDYELADEQNENRIVSSSSSDEEEPNYMEPNDCEGNSINLELSCIANRTRKRKSIKQLRLSIELLEDSRSTSSLITSATSYSTLMTPSSSRTSYESLPTSTASSTASSLANVNSKKRRYLRLPSSEDSESYKSQNSLKKRTISPSVYQEKCPQRNLSVFLNSKLVSKSSINSASIYYPNNQYHPHSNNHRRV